MNLKIITLSGRKNRQKRSLTVWFYLYTILENANEFIVTRSGTVVWGGARGRDSSRA